MSRETVWEAILGGLRSSSWTPFIVALAPILLILVLVAASWAMQALL